MPSAAHRPISAGSGVVPPTSMRAQSAIRSAPRRRCPALRRRIRRAAAYRWQHTAVPAAAYCLAAGAIIVSSFFSMKSSTSFDAPFAALPHFMVP